jgi:hypothetical protein
LEAVRISCRNTKMQNRERKKEKEKSKRRKRKKEDWFVQHRLCAPTTKTICTDLRQFTYSASAVVDGARSDDDDDVLCMSLSLGATVLGSFSIVECL